ncbi:MAG TPA: hypothetical protein VGO74_05550 [Modestobacter sp.]|nr:hypothetical protein [Modestobacter sp.]
MAGSRARPLATAARGELSLLAGVLDERAGRWAGGRDGGGWAP